MARSPPPRSYALADGGVSWRPDVNVTCEEPRLAALARWIGGPIYLLHESDGRDSLAAKPTMTEPGHVPAIARPLHVLGGVPTITGWLLVHATGESPTTVCSSPGGRGDYAPRVTSRLDRVHVQTPTGLVEIPWSSRQALLAEIHDLQSMRPSATRSRP